MTGMEVNSPEKRHGCGLFNAVFGRRNVWPRRTTSTGSLPVANGKEYVKQPGTPRRRRSGSDEAAFIDPPPPPKPVAKPTPTGATNHSRNTPPAYHQIPVKISPNQGYVNRGRRVPKEAVGISGELESMIADHQKSKGTGNLVRASSSNVMLFGNLGNLRQPGTGNSNSGGNVMDYLPKPARDEIPAPANGRYNNTVKKQSDEKPPPTAGEVPPGTLCRAISTRMDPETLKIMGNEDYKNGNFAEALALYDAAIAIDPNKASYRSNKCAALTALGRILDAVFECREAIRIEPHYHRAHNRLANLYLRLGETEKSIYHYRHAGPEADPDIINNAKILQNHLNKCTEARKQRDWNTVIKATGCAIAAGADSAPQIYSLQAEALLKLHKYQDADEALSKSPKFDVDSCTKFFGLVGNANMLMIQSQVHMAGGRLADALAAAKQAARLDSNNREVNIVLRRAQAVATARSNGNALFKASRFSEACGAYSEGLDHDPYNSVLLCNRATCRAKLGQFQKALDDCNAALNIRPSYTKARLRRADCFTKVEKWEAAKQDYEILLKEIPGDEEASLGLLQAQLQLKKLLGENEDQTIN